MKAGQKIRVNVQSRVNNSDIEEVVIEGRNFLRVPSATMPDNIVMNGVFYPAAEISKAFGSLEGTPAPLGHPFTEDGSFRSASDPMALAHNYVGAHNANVRRKDGRVHVDKMIDVEIAGSLERGKRVLAAIDEGKPIHTSTGLYCSLSEPLGNEETDEEFKFVASDIFFDHDAILLDEVGAATPEQGTGMMVNTALDADNNEVVVLNYSLQEAIEEEIDYLGVRLVEQIERRKAVSKWDQFKSAFMDMFDGSTRETSTENEEDDMSKELEGKVDGLAANLASFAETVTNSLTEMQSAIAATATSVNSLTNSLQAEEIAKRKELVDSLVNDQVLTEEEAKNTPLSVLQTLANSKAKGVDKGPLGTKPAANAKEAANTFPED